MSQNTVHDFETFSASGMSFCEATNKWIALPNAKQGKKGLTVVGAAVYAQHPSTEVLCYRYRLPGQPSRHWRPGLPPPQDLFDAIKAGVILEAWNSAFERWIWDEVCRPKYGFPEWPFAQQRCDMAAARAHALPGSLGEAGDVIRADVRKDKRGDALIKKFCAPRTPTKLDSRKRILCCWGTELEVAEQYVALGYDPSKFPKGWYALDRQDTIDFDHYNDFDLKAESSISARVPVLEGEELEFWQADQAINRRGIHVDREGMNDCITVIEQVFEVYLAEMVGITGGIAPTQLAKLADWLRARDVPVRHGKGSMDEEAIEEYLEWVSSQPDWEDHAGLRDAHRVLELRALVGSASVKKVYAMRNTMARGDQIHDSFLYHAARTGRANGQGAQPANMPNSGPGVHRCMSCKRYHNPARLSCPWCGVAGMPRPPKYKPAEWCFEAAEDARDVLALRDYRMVEHVMGDAMQVVSGVLRGLFCAPEGYDLVSADYSSIEAVVIAMLAGESWRIEVFRTHGKIYEASASQMFGVPLQEILDAPKLTGAHHTLRKQGKVSELALAYAGWVGAAKAFDMPGTDEEIKANIKAWRKASPAIVELWGGQSRGFGRDAYPCLYGIEGMAIKALQNPNEWFDVVRLDGTPSGLSYIAVGRTLFGKLPSGRLLTYHFCQLVPSTREYAAPWELSLSYEGYNTNPKNGPTGWIRMSTYAGKLTENCIAEGTEVLTARGWVRIESIEADDLIHDGVEFVRHGGKMPASVQACQQIDGVWMTPDHEVLSNGEWKTASSSPQPDRPEVRHADGDVARGFGGTATPHDLDVSLRMRPDEKQSRDGRAEGYERGARAELRLRHQVPDRLQELDARDDLSPGLLGVAVDARPLPIANAPSMAELRRAGDSRLPEVGRVVRGVLVGHGADVCAGAGNRPGEQRRGLRARQLPLGHFDGAMQQPEGQSAYLDPARKNDGVSGVPVIRGRQNDDPLPDSAGVARGQTAGAPELRRSRVFDILNCGPRHRFVVRGAEAPFIVHNCVQATARDILRRAIINLEKSGYPVILHVYDEIASMIPEGWGSTDEFSAIMGTMPEFAADWPIRVGGAWRGKRYRK